MRHTALTDQNVYNINMIIGFLDTLVDEMVVYEQGAPKIKEMFDTYVRIAESIKLDDIKTEFWELANDFEAPMRLRNIYQIKFKVLLNWEIPEKYNTSFFMQLIDERLIPFINRHIARNIVIEIEYIMSINKSFMLLLTMLFTCREEIQSILEQCDAFAGIDNQAPTPASPTTTSHYRLASKRKTDFIKLLSAMYDSRLFVDKEGNPVANKQKLMEDMGRFLNDDFSAYSASLSQAKNRDEKTFLKPFKEIEKEALRYFNAVGE